MIFPLEDRRAVLSPEPPSGVVRRLGRVMNKGTLIDELFAVVRKAEESVTLSEADAASPAVRERPVENDNPGSRNSEPE